MNWIESISLLWTQTHKINLKDFQNLCMSKEFESQPDQIFKVLEPGLLRNFLLKKKNWYSESLRAFKQVQSVGASFTYPGHPHYPKSFYQIPNPPIFISYLGIPCWLNHHRLAVVGSREPSNRVLEWMDMHLTEVVNKNFILISGAARGVDQKAHSICIRNQKPTVAFLPSGLSQIYPNGFRQWVAYILNHGGAIVSEYAPQTPMRKHHFRERNRMIAGLAQFVFVAEAQRRSGSTMTAHLALENGQGVGVLPSFPTDLKAKGTLDLLYDGAQPIRDSIDLEMLCL